LKCTYSIREVIFFLYFLSLYRTYNKKSQKTNYCWEENKRYRGAIWLPLFSLLFFLSRLASFPWISGSGIGSFAGFLCVNNWGQQKPRAQQSEKVLVDKKKKQKNIQTHTDTHWANGFSICIENAESWGGEFVPLMMAYDGWKCPCVLLPSDYVLKGVYQDFPTKPLYNISYLRRIYACTENRMLLNDKKIILN